jgi:tRNA threonylcarbamoyl adenosine modification protein YeaZ
LLLAIDTSAGTSAAVLDDEKVLGFSLFEDPFGHAENIGLAIIDALNQAEILAIDVTAVAVGRGPAPYTGLRVGMATGTTFAMSLGIPLYGVMVLDAIALSQSSKKFYVVADAKRKELFLAGYELGVRTFGPEVIQPVELERFSDYEAVALACDARLVGQYAHRALDEGIDLSDVSALYLRSPDVAPSPGKKVSG